MQLNREFNRILEISDVRDQALAQGTDLESQTPEQFGAFLVAQTTKWAKVAKAAGMLPVPASVSKPPVTAPGIF